MNHLSNESRGMLLGLIGVIAFSLTLPATRAAVASLDPLFVSAGHATLAALLAAIYLYAGHHRRPASSKVTVALLGAALIAMTDKTASSLLPRRCVLRASRRIWGNSRQRINALEMPVDKGASNKTHSLLRLLNSACYQLHEVAA